MKAHIFETSIEKLLRVELERRGFLNGIDFSCQYPLRYGYIIDFAFPEKMIAVEADGNIWHSTQKYKKRDKQKDHILRKIGWKVLRFSEEDILNSASVCVDSIISVLNEER
jgi:very-short-patch-repair endonuclease